MSFPISPYASFLLAVALASWQPGQVAAQEAETVAAPLSAEQMLEAAIVDLKGAMSEALQKNTQIVDKNKALRQDLVQYEKELTVFQAEKDQIAEDHKVLQEALRLQDEAREALRKDLEALRAQEGNRDVYQAEKAQQMNSMLEKQTQLQEEAQLLKEEVAFFKKRRQQKSAQSFLRDREQEKKSLEDRLEVLRKNSDKKREDVSELQQRIASQKERTAELKAQKERWLKRLADLQNQLAAVEGNADNLKQQREATELKGQAVLNKLEDDIAQLQDNKEQLERAFVEMRDLEELVRVAYRQQEKQAVLFRRELMEENERLREKRQVLEDLLPLQKAAASLDAEPRHDPLAVSQEKLIDNIDDLNLSLRKGRLKIKAYHKKEKLLSKDIARLKVDYQKARQRQDSSESAEEIKEELTRLLSEVDLDDKPRVSPGEEPRPAPVSEGQKLGREIEALQLREAVLTSSLSIIQARYEEEQKAAENFYNEEGQLYEYLQVLLRENKGLQEKVRGLLKAKEKGDNPQ